MVGVGVCNVFADYPITRLPDFDWLIFIVWKVSCDWSREITALQHYSDNPTRWSLGGPTYLLSDWWKMGGCDWLPTDHIDDTDDIEYKVSNSLGVGGYYVPVVPLLLLYYFS